MRVLALKLASRHARPNCRPDELLAEAELIAAWLEGRANPSFSSLKPLAGMFPARPFSRPTKRTQQRYR